MLAISIPSVRVLCVAALIAVSNGSRQEVLAASTANIRVRSDLVLINALVTDVHGAVVTESRRDRSFIFSTKASEQIIKYCASEDSPVSIGLILDTSGSMGDKLSAVKKAAVQFVRAANPI